MVASTHSEIPRSALANGAENRNREEAHPSPDETPSQQVPDSVCRPRPQAPCVWVLHRGSPCAKARSPSTNFPEFGARRSRKPSHRPKHVSPKLPSPAIHLPDRFLQDRKSTRLNSSHDQISYAVFCLKKKNKLNSNNLHTS